MARHDADGDDLQVWKIVPYMLSKPIVNSQQSVVLQLKDLVGKNLSMKQKECHATKAIIFG
jgi:hypothetical protein